MDSVAELLDQVRALGVALRVRDGAVEISPPNLLPPALRSDLRRCREDVLRALHDTVAVEPATGIAVTRCAWCHERPGDGGLDLLGKPWCSRCRDAEQAAQTGGLVAVVSDAEGVAAEWRSAARELSDIAGYPKLTFRTGHSVEPGQATWGKWIGQANVPDLQLVVTGLRRLIAEMRFLTGD